VVKQVPSGDLSVDTGTICNNSGADTTAGGVLDLINVVTTCP